MLGKGKKRRLTILLNSGISELYDIMLPYLSMTRCYHDSHVFNSIIQNYTDPNKKLLIQNDIIIMNVVPIII